MYTVKLKKSYIVYLDIKGKIKAYYIFYLTVSKLELFYFKSLVRIYTVKYLESFLSQISSLGWIFEKLSPIYASLSCKMIFLHYRKNARLKIRKIRDWLQKFV